MASPAGYEWRDPDTLVKWTTRLVYAYLVGVSLSALFGYLEHEVLLGIRDDTLEGDSMAAAEASDLRQGILALLQVPVIVTTGVLSLRWIHRANNNARALGADGLQFTPGWCVGWYFIPVLNLWKPFSAMKEIWIASTNPSGWQLEQPPRLLGWWWLCWVVVTLTGNVAFRLQIRAEDLDSLITTNVVNQISDLASIPLCITFLRVIHGIHKMQAERKATAETPGVAAPVGATAG